MRHFLPFVLTSYFAHAARFLCSLDLDWTKGRTARCTVASNKGVSGPLAASRSLYARIAFLRIAFFTYCKRLLTHPSQKSPVDRYVGPISLVRSRGTSLRRLNKYDCDHRVAVIDS